jgi:drug/metabolite transporter (DMT)-like permease
VAGSPEARRRALLADAALLTVAIAWGFNFVVIKDAIGANGPMTYLLWRHIVDAILLVAIMPRTVRQTTRRDWVYGGVLGLFLFVAFATQTIGCSGPRRARTASSPASTS